MEQILPATLNGKGGATGFDTDEHGRLNVTPDDFTRLKPVFQRDACTITAANASDVNDAAAALVLMERATTEQRGGRPLARVVAYAHAGVDPKVMGILALLVDAEQGVLFRSNIPLSPSARAVKPCRVKALLDLCWAFIFFIIRLMSLPNRALAVRPLSRLHFSKGKR